jgi:dienelactone hydrolase
MPAFAHLPRDVRGDAPLWGHLTGVPRRTPVRVVARAHDDSGRTWESAAGYRATPEGVVDLAASAPSEAAWTGSDAYGLSGSMQPVTLHNATQTGAETASAEDTFLMSPLQESLAPLPVDLVAEVEGAPMASARFERRFLSRCAQEDWRGELTANLFVPDRPDRPGPWPATLILGGSGGGFAWANQVAALIAASGRPALALAYFDWGGVHGLPTSITEIPLETFTAALDRLMADRRLVSDDLAIVGYSKGAEAALLVAARRPEIRRVVAYAPSAYTWEAARMDPNAPAHSSWSWAGRPLPFAPLEIEPAFYASFDKTLLLAAHERTLGDARRASAVAEARIPVHEIGAEVLLMSGTADRVWPSTAMAESIVGAYRDAGQEARVRHLAFEGARHYFMPPGMPAARSDGTPAANAYADRKAWGALRAHLALE